jgi:hypothetical protein
MERTVVLGMLSQVPIRISSRWKNCMYAAPLYHTGKRSSCRGGSPRGRRKECEQSHHGRGMGQGWHSQARM